MATSWRALDLNKRLGGLLAASKRRLGPEKRSKKTFRDMGTGSAVLFQSSMLFLVCLPSSGVWESFWSILRACGGLLGASWKPALRALRSLRSLARCARPLRNRPRKAPRSTQQPRQKGSVWHQAGALRALLRLLARRAFGVHVACLGPKTLAS